MAVAGGVAKGPFKGSDCRFSFSYLQRAEGWDICNSQTGEADNIHYRTTRNRHFLAGMKVWDR